MTLIETEDITKMPEDVSGKEVGEESIKEKVESPPLSVVGEVKTKESDDDRYLRTWRSSDPLVKERLEYQKYLDEKQALREERKKAALEGLKEETQPQETFRSERNRFRSAARFLREIAKGVPLGVAAGVALSVGTELPTWWNAMAAAEVAGLDAGARSIGLYGRATRRARGLLRGVAAAAFKGVGGMSMRVGEGLEPKPTSPRTSGTPAPGPGLDSLR